MDAAVSRTDKMSSPYYPPRARWYSPIFSLWFALRRGLHLEKIPWPGGLSVFVALVSLVVPGFIFIAKGRKILGGAILAGYSALALIFLVALGYPAANLAFGLMISLHTTSIIYLETYWMEERSDLATKVTLAVCNLLILWLLIYLPLIGFAERNWFRPVRVRDRVFIVRPQTSPRDVRPGDRIIYSLNGAEAGEAHTGGGAVRMPGGFGFGPVLATAGDRVQFSTNSFAVNGVLHPSMPHMPVSGEFVVPEKQWFIWPEFDMYVHGNIAEANISAMWLQMALVTEKQLLGAPYKSWFWRRQNRL